MHVKRVTPIFFASLVLLAIYLMPAFSFAQSDELRATVRAKLMEDPRASTMTEADFNAMVDILSAQAEREGLTARDITWQPDIPGTVTVAEDTCQDILCRMNSAFGFEGDDLTIPIGLGVSSALLILIIGALIEHHRRHEQIAAAVAPSPLPPISTPQK